MQLLSRYCILCGFISDKEIICANCADKLHFSRLEVRFSHFCSCGLPVIGSSSCTACTRVAVGHHACFFYGGIVRELMHAYKFQGYRQIAGLFAIALSGIARNLDNPCMVPVPGHPANVRRRGWDQMEAVLQEPLLADVPVFRLLRHSRRARNQKSLLRKQRYSNSHSIFSIDTREIEALLHQELSGYSIFIVDDIRSTGATLSSAADLLAIAGISVCGTISLAMH